MKSMVYKPQSSEELEQKTLISWSKHANIPDTQYKVIDYLIHIPNGGSRHTLEAYNLKQCGVKPGVSDLFLAYPNKLYHGLWIELKAPRNPKPKLTNYQKDWLDKMACVGYSARVAYGFDEAKNIIEGYLEDKKKIEEEKDAEL